MARRAALLVGTAAYDDQKLTPLPAAALDLAGLAEVLGAPEIGAFEVTVATAPAANQLRREVGAFFRQAQVDDDLLLYLACHGLVDEDGRLHFAASDTSADHPEEDGLPAAFVAERMARSRARRIVVLLDCCYSARMFDGLLGRGAESVHLNDQFATSGQGKAILAASDSLQPAFEDGQRSLFTAALIDGLRSGEADLDGDGWVSVDELYRFVYDRLRRDQAPQQPRLWNDLLGTMYVARSPGPYAGGGDERTDDWPELPAMPPSTGHGLRSRHSNTETFVEFVNRRAEPVEVHWLDYAGTRVIYTTLPGGDRYVQQTYLTHPWVIRTLDGTELALFMPDPRPARAIVR